MRTEPAKNRVSIKDGASPARPSLAAFRWVSSLAVTKVAIKVIQLTIGTAIDKSDLATRKLLKMLAPQLTRNGIKNAHFVNILTPSLSSFLSLSSFSFYAAAYSSSSLEPTSINAFVDPQINPVTKYPSTISMLTIIISSLDDLLKSYYNYNRQKERIYSHFLKKSS